MTSPLFPGDFSNPYLMPWEKTGGYYADHRRHQFGPWHPWWGWAWTIQEANALVVNAMQGEGPFMVWVLATNEVAVCLAGGEWVYGRL